MSENQINLKNDNPTASIQSSYLNESTHGKADISGTGVMTSENSSMSISGTGVMTSENSSLSISGTGVMTSENSSLSISGTGAMTSENSSLAISGTGVMTSENSSLSISGTGVMTSENSSLSISETGVMASENSSLSISETVVMPSENSFLSKTDSLQAVGSMKINSDSHGKIENISTSVGHRDLMTNGSNPSNVTDDPLAGCFEVSKKSDEKVKKVSKIIIRPTQNQTSLKVADTQIMQTLGFILRDPEQTSNTFQLHKLQLRKPEALKNVKLQVGEITTQTPVAIQPRAKSLLKTIVVDSTASTSYVQTTPITSSIQPHTTPATLQESSDNVVKNAMLSNSAGPHFMRHGRLVFHSPASNKITPVPTAGTNNTVQATAAKTAAIHSIIGKIIQNSKTSSPSALDSSQTHIGTSLLTSAATLTVQNGTKTTEHSTSASDVSSLPVPSSIVSKAKTSLITMSNVTRSSLPPPTNPLVPKLSVQPVLIKSSLPPSTGAKTATSNVKSTVSGKTTFNLKQLEVSNVRNESIHSSLTSVANLAVQPSTTSKHSSTTNSVLSNLETEPIIISNSPPQPSTLSQPLPFTAILNNLKQSHQSSQNKKQSHQSSQNKKQSHQSSQNNQTPEISHSGNQANNVNQAVGKRKYVQILGPPLSSFRPLAANLLVPATVTNSNVPNNNVRPNITPAANRTYFYISSPSPSPATFTSPVLAQSPSRFSKLAFVPTELVQSHAGKPIVFPHQVGAETVRKTQTQAVCTSGGLANANPTTTVVSVPNSASTSTVAGTGKKTPPKMILLLPSSSNDASLGTFGQGASKSSLLRYKVKPVASSKSILNPVSNLKNSVEMLPCVTVKPDDTLTFDPVKEPKKRKPRQRKSKQNPQNLNLVAPITSREPKGVFVTSLRTGQGLVPVRLLFPDMGDGSDEIPEVREDDVFVTHLTKPTAGHKNAKLATIQSSVPSKNISDKISAPNVPYISVDDGTGSETDSDTEQSFMTEEQDIRLLNTLLTSSKQSQNKTADEVTVNLSEQQAAFSHGPLDFTITGSRIGGLQGVSSFQEMKRSVPNLVAKEKADVLELKTSKASPCSMPDQSVEKPLNGQIQSKLASDLTPNIGQLTKDRDQCVHESTRQGKQNIQEIINNNNENPAMDESCDLKIESVFSLKNHKDHLGLEDFNSIIDLSEDVQADSFNVCLSNDWKQIIVPCFVVVERLSKAEVRCQGGYESLSRCSTHCRKRTLDYLCKLNLLACDDLPDVQSVSPPKKVGQMCEPETDQAEMLPHTTINPDPCVVMNPDPCVVMNPDPCVVMNPDPSLPEPACPIPVTGTTHEARPLTPSSLSLVGKGTSKSPQDVPNANKSPGSKSKKSPVSDYDLMNKNAGFHKLLQRLKKQVEKRRKQLQKCKKCQKRKRKQKIALEQGRGAESNVSQALPEQTPEYHHSDLNESVGGSQSLHAKSLSNFNSSSEKRIRKRRTDQNISPGVKIQKVSPGVKGQNISPGVKGHYSDMANISNSLTPSSVQKLLNSPTASTSHSSVGQATDVSNSPSNTAPLLHSVTINPSGQIIERTPHISQSKVENALKSLVKYLMMTGRNPTMDDNHYFLLKIDNDHVLVKISSGPLPPLHYGCEPGGSNVQKVDKTNIAPATKINNIATPSTNIIASPQTNITDTPKTNIASPQSNIIASPQIKIKASPKTNIIDTPKTNIASPQTNIKAWPQSNIIASPQTNIVASPQTNIIASSKTNITPLSQTNIIASPQANMIAPPKTNSTSTPHTNRTSTPQINIIATPQTKILASPQTSSTAALKHLLTMASEQMSSFGNVKNKTQDSVHLSSSSAPPMVLSNTDRTGTCILPQSQRSITLMRNSKKNRQSINTIISTPIHQPPQQTASIVNCDYGDSRSILSHLPPDSTLLPCRRKTTLQLTQAEHASRRQRLKQKYPLPPGIVIKSEPDDSEYALDDNWTVTSEISMTSTLPSPFVSNLITDPIQTGVSKESELTSSSVARRDGCLETSDDPPCLTDETSSGPQLTPHTKESERDPTEDLPPVLQPMFTSAPTSAVVGHDTLNLGKDASTESSNTDSRLGDQIIHSPDALQSLEAAASVSSSSLLSDKSYESHDSGYNTEPPSSAADSSAFVNKPAYRNSKIERLKELLKKKEMEIETMRKRQSEIPMLDLDTV